jgi:ATP synthase protein I
MAEPRGGGISGGEFAGIGIQFALVILLFTGAGIWLDRRLGTSPWLLLVCVFLGAGGGMFSIYQKAIAAQRRDAEQRAKRRADETASRGSGK